MKEIFDYLEKNYRYLNNYLKDIDENLFKSPHSAIIKARTFGEHLVTEVGKIENISFAYNMPQLEKLRLLESEGVIGDGDDVDTSFHAIRKLGNLAAHGDVDGELEAALNVHKNVYKLACWFIGTYIDYTFEAEAYKTPMPKIQSQVIDKDAIAEVMKQTIKELGLNEGKNDNIRNLQDDMKGNAEIAASLSSSDEEIDDAYTELMIEGIFDENNKMCLVQELSKLKESSKEAVESLGEFTPFKRYMHIARDAQHGLDELIQKANQSDKAQLILVCGSVGDGKSHIISYFKNKYPEEMSKFKLHNDATESLEPNKTSMDTLNEVLDEFSDEKVDNSTQKVILAINLGTLNNFIDSQYGERFTKLRKFVDDKKILESSIEDSSFDQNSSFQYVNFSDYHLFTLKNGKVHSDYIVSLIQKIISPSENNIFYKSYKNNCIKCDNSECCPMKKNYELLSQDNVQNSIVDLLVECIVKNKIIISTRALLNFMYELIIPISYIDVNSPTFKNKIPKLNNQEYIQSLIPNIIFDHKELSFIFDSLNSIDPLNVRNEKIDDFIIDFNNTNKVLEYFEEYIDFSNGYLEKLKDIDFDETQDKKIKSELLKLFIRSYYICGKGELFSLRDKDYNDYMMALFYWNKGDKSKLRDVYNNVKEGIIKWNGEADKNHINIFLGKNQLKYKVSEKIELKADTGNLDKSNEDDLKKFIGTLKLRYKGENHENSHEIDIDYSLYKLLIQVNNGYRPNKKDKNHFIKFVEFINKLEETGSQNEELVFTEKNREDNKKFKLEYDDEFETYRFMEI